MSSLSKQPIGGRQVTREEARRGLFKEMGILFTGLMVLKIQSGEKTQTRRVAKTHLGANCKPRFPWKCPYGEKGDGLWVRETWGPYEGGVIYRCDESPNCKPDGGAWKPSIFMPRWASRITLEITDVRLERLQEISELDARSEGVNPYSCETALEQFPKLWDSINAKRGYRWETNPWCWCISFNRVK